MKKCFVCMPLIPQTQEIYDAIEAEVTNTLGKDRWECNRANDTRRPGMVTEKIVRLLLNADLVIAVVADPRGENSINPNVMYELGVAHSFRKPAIVVADTKDVLPFDIRPVEVIQLDFQSPKFIADLREILADSLRDAEFLDDLERKRIPRNPITIHLMDTRIFIEDLPWLWGYCDVLRREREATTVWEITRDLYWPGEDLFFATLKEAMQRNRRHYFMVEDDPTVAENVERIRNSLLLQGFGRSDIDRLIHFVAIKKDYFVLWPIAIVLYDANLVKGIGGIICEPMQSQVGNDEFDNEIRDLFDQHGRSGDLGAFEKRLLERDWTQKRKEVTFDIRLDGRVVKELANAFKKIWNEKIVEEADSKTGDEKAALLTWLIGRASE